jgi:hypothetical protein
MKFNSSTASETNLLIAVLLDDSPVLVSNWRSALSSLLVQFDRFLTCISRTNYFSNFLIWSFRVPALGFRIFLNNVNNLTL